jgi:hypothetical protein
MDHSATGDNEAVRGNEIERIFNHVGPFYFR